MEFGCTDSRTVSQTAGFWLCVQSIRSACIGSFAVKRKERTLGFVGGHRAECERGTGVMAGSLHYTLLATSRGRQATS